MNRDGTIDEPLVINEHNMDNHALSGEFSSFQAYSNLRVNVISNSSIANLTYIQPNGTIILEANSSATNQGSGFCRISIPHGLIIGPYNVTIDNTAPSYINDSLYDDGDTRWMYFNYPNSGREVSIQGVDKTIPAVSLFARALVQLAVIVIVVGVVIAVALLVYFRKSRNKTPKAGR